MSKRLGVLYGKDGKNDISSVRNIIFPEGWRILKSTSLQRRRIKRISKRKNKKLREMTRGECADYLDRWKKMEVKKVLNGMGMPATKDNIFEFELERKKYM